MKYPRAKRNAAILRDLRFLFPVRFVLVRELKTNQWEAVFRDGDKVVYRTEIGAKRYVLEAVNNYHDHRGLPVVINPLPNTGGRDERPHR
jgi:hypothetical protein